MATLITFGETLDTSTGALLSDENDNYVLFDGISDITNSESVTLEDNKVNIGIYRIKDEEETETATYKYYAFAGTGNVEEANNGNDDDPTLIASGTGTLTGNKITDIEIMLNNVVIDEDNPIKKLGFTGDAISKITGSDGADTAYIIGKQENDDENAGISSNVVLDFQSGKDTVYSIGATTVSQISGGGVRRGRKYTYSQDYRRSVSQYKSFKFLVG